MPSSCERRSIEWFITGYNTCNEPKITNIFADALQEAPDAICRLEDGRKIALELTSMGAPKGTSARKTPHQNPDLEPLIKIMNRKFKNDYRDNFVDEVWLLIHLRLTLPQELVEKAVKDVLIPPRFDRVYLQWPLPGKFNRININILQLPERRFWTPDLPRPSHCNHQKIQLTS